MYSSASLCSNSVVFEVKHKIFDDAVPIAIPSVLERIKKTCTVVLCTHHVDSAVQIADRIAIILENKLHCYGTPSFVKALVSL